MLNKFVGNPKRWTATVLERSKNVLNLILQCFKNVKFLKISVEFLKKSFKTTLNVKLSYIPFKYKIPHIFYIETNKKNSFVSLYPLVCVYKFYLIKHILSYTRTPIYLLLYTYKYTHTRMNKCQN